MSQQKNCIDYKVTSWVRAHIDDKSNINKIVDDLKNHKYLPSDGLDIDTGYEALFDTEEYITPSENGGCSTIEVYDKDGNLIWQNGQ